MDFENAFWLFLLVAYLVLQFLGRKRKPKSPLPEGEAPLPKREEHHTLEDALREIRTALGVETPPVVPERPFPTPKPRPSSPRKVVTVSPPPPFPKSEEAYPSPHRASSAFPASKLRKKLRGNDSFREAFVLSEILAPPVSRRRR